MKKTIYLSPERRPAPHGKYWGMNIYEHNVCCEIAEMMKPLLEGSGFSVIIANPADTMEKRVAQANALKVNYYMPIHTNASGNGTTAGTATGAECLYYGNVGGASYKANQLVYNELVKLYPSKRGLKNGNAYYENKYTNMVSCYVEIAFHDNPEDVQFIISSKQKIAGALAKGVCAYYGLELNEPNNLKEQLDKANERALQAEAKLEKIKSILK